MSMCARMCVWGVCGGGCACACACACVSEHGKTICQVCSYSPRYVGMRHDETWHFVFHFFISIYRNFIFYYDDSSLQLQPSVCRQEARGMMSSDNVLPAWYQMYYMQILLVQPVCPACPAVCKYSICC